MSFNNRDKIMVAHYYYKLEYKQQEIAEKFGMSRQRVNRLLKQALSEGVVEIKVNGYENAILESKLESKLGLREAIVVDSSDISTLSAVSIKYLKSIVSDGCNIGVSGGNTMAMLCDAPISNENHDIKVVQLMGGMITSNIFMRPDEITSKFAKIFGGEANVLLAPAIVDDPNLGRLLMEDSQYKDIRTMYSNLNIAVVSIGALMEGTLLLQVGYLNRNDFGMLHEKRCIGDVLMRFINIEGEIVDPQFDARVIGIPVDEFKKIDLRVGVSYGSIKVKPIIGAINGKFINVLITDSDTAKLLLEFNQ